MVIVVKGISTNIGSPIEQIRSLIANPPSTSRVFEITPEMAKVLLVEFNKGNRAKKLTAIAKYAKHMANGEWVLTGDTLKFSNKARLRDGQNRLMSCVRAGVPFSTHVVFGIEDDAFDILDRGVNRSGADILSIAGYDNTKALGAAIRWTHLISTGRVKQRDVFDPSELLKIVQSHYPTLTDFISHGRAIYKATNEPIGLVTAMVYLFHQANTAMAHEFTSAWESGARGGRFKPLGLLHGQISKKLSDNSGRIHDVERAGLMVQAWNLFVARRKGTISDMKYRLSDPFPEIAR